MYQLKHFPPPATDLTSATPEWSCAPFGFTEKCGDDQSDLFWSLVDILDYLDPYGKTWELVSFGLWTKSSKDITFIFVQPGSKCFAACQILCPPVFSIKES